MCTNLNSVVNLTRGIARGVRGVLFLRHADYLHSRCVGAGTVPAPWQAKGGALPVPTASGSVMASY